MFLNWYCDLIEQVSTDCFSCIEMPIKEIVHPRGLGLWDRHVRFPTHLILVSQQERMAVSLSSSLMMESMLYILLEKHFFWEAIKELDKI